MTRPHHHHHGRQQQHHYQQPQQQQGHDHPGAMLLGAAALGAAVNHHTRPPRQEVIIVQQQQHPPSNPNPQDQHYYPHGSESYIYIKRPNQPPLRLVSSTRLLSSRPPGWRLQGHCEVCFVTFGLFKRRHHCRNCGRSVCQTHAGKKMPLPHWGFLNYVRVCDGCHDVVMNCFRTGAPYHPALLLAHPQHQQHQQYLQRQQQQQQQQQQQEEVPQERAAFGQHWQGGATTMDYANPYTPVGMGVVGGEGAGGGAGGGGVSGNGNFYVPMSGQPGQQVMALPHAEPVSYAAAAEGIWATASVQQQQQHPEGLAQPSAPPLVGEDYPLPPTTR